uniref:Uncharacterized protein MANES_14G085900 n=1 Tax=Rhizophora mucronata TaxID=61149 RepID=A0A2P2KTI3_RHIMU
MPKSRISIISTANTTAAIVITPPTTTGNTKILSCIVKASSVNSPREVTTGITAKVSSTSIVTTSITTNTSKTSISTTAIISIATASTIASTHTIATTSTVATTSVATPTKAATRSISCIVHSDPTTMKLLPIKALNGTRGLITGGVSNKPKPSRPTSFTIKNDSCFNDFAIFAKSFS